MPNNLFLSKDGDPFAGSNGNGVVGCYCPQDLLRRCMRKRIGTAMRASAARPPITPPTMAPVLLLEDEDEDDEEDVEISARFIRIPDHEWGILSTNLRESSSF